MPIGPSKFLKIFKTLENFAKALALWIGSKMADDYFLLVYQRANEMLIVAKLQSLTLCNNISFSRKQVLMQVLGGQH